MDGIARESTRASHSLRIMDNSLDKRQRFCGVYELSMVLPRVLLSVIASSDVNHTSNDDPD